MISTIFWIFVGAFIGWAIPQPEWAKNMQETALERLHAVINKK